MAKIACDWEPRATKGYICTRCNLKTCNPRRRVCRNQKIAPGQSATWIASGRRKPKPARDYEACRECVHFIDVTEEQTEAAKCGGCKTATPMTTLAECELHGLVTFVHRAKDKAIKCCRTCRDYEAE